MSTIETRRRTAPPAGFASTRATCAAGHPWRPETTRWRYRDRSSRTDGHGWSGWERDCLVCKDVADKSRARNRAGRQQQLLVDITTSGEVWHTRGGAA